MNFAPTHGQVEVYFRNRKPSAKKPPQRARNETATPRGSKKKRLHFSLRVLSRRLYELLVRFSSWPKSAGDEPKK